MFCVIQEIQTRKEYLSNTYERIEVSRTDHSHGPSFYGYCNAGKQFERPIKKAYKISIHHSYRKEGKVKKKQWVIATMSYYDLLEYWPGDCILQSKLNEKLEEMGITEEELWDMVYKKLDPLIKKIEAEFKQTKEYKAKQEQNAILEKHRKVSYEFEKLYGTGTYKYCYDVFGNLMNEEYLFKIMADYEAKIENERKSREYQKRSQEEFFKNYSSGGSYSNSSSGNYNKNEDYTDDEKEMLKVIYKQSAKIAHPDSRYGSEKMMKFVNRLKDEWGI